MYCSNCGAKLAEGTRYCSNCGAKISSNIEDIKDTAAKVEDKITSTVDEIADSVSEEVNKTVNTIADEIKETKEDISNSFTEEKENREEKIEDFNSKAKSFNKETLKTREFADKATAIVTLLPLAYVAICKIVFGILCFIPKLIWNFTGAYFVLRVLMVIGSISNIFFYIICFGGLVLTVAAIMSTVYRMMAYDEKDQINKLEIVGSVIAYVFFILELYKAFNSSSTILTVLCVVAIIASIYFGLGFGIKAFSKKEAFTGEYNLGKEFDSIKANKKEKAPKAKKEEPKETVNVERETIIDNSEGKSYYDGKGLDILVYLLGYGLLSTITCGLAAPWGICKIMQYKESHTVIEGRRCQFNGTATQLWGLWIKWWLLSIITCGIYSYFAAVEYLKWQAKHTSFVGDVAVDGVFENCYFDGNAFEYVGYILLTGLISSITCGLAFPWMLVIISKWLYKSRVIQGRRMKFEADGGEYFATYLIHNVLLTGITCGIYSSWALVKQNEFIISHVRLLETADKPA